ncbi:MAG: ferrochelatase [Acidobacteria bacterium]|nr:ferrochelatase [Acidobacteriota bacterium]MBI3279911.1 ferrochelatase [Acidobacteriota bacterium]
MQPYQAVVIVSFGGPEKPEEVMPFLEHVTRGRRVPRERLLEVAEHYRHFGGASPINQQNRALAAALRARLQESGPDLPVYFGNRNWHPFLDDTLREMARDEVQRALAFVTSAFGSYSGCRQYREDIERARGRAGAGALQVEKLRAFYNHPGFIEAWADGVKEALDAVPTGRRSGASLTFTAHSVPVEAAAASPYEQQLREACRLVSESAGHPAHVLVYQSRSGRPGQPWLEPDILDHLRTLAVEDCRDVVVAPIGFLSDHIEVVYDLDTEAQQLSRQLGLNMLRARTPGTHAVFVEMIRQLIVERVDPAAPRLALGDHGPVPDVCAPECCTGNSQDRP